MYYDDLPIWGFIGKIEKIVHPGDRTEYKYYLFTHIHFDILYNGKRVIEVRVGASGPQLCQACITAPSGVDEVNAS